MTDKLYEPQKKSRLVLDRAWEHVQSVPYAVSARWLFYRLYQEGIYTDKSDYKRKFLPLLSRARKEFYGEWRPWTLADDTRQIVTQGDGWRNEREWLQAVSEAECNLSRLAGQPAILAVLFEAKAMSAQFEHYLPNAAILFPFGGDPSIPAKWNLAKMLAERWEEYRVPVYIVYFGDFDKKGLAIEKTAKAEILNWARMNDPGGDYHWKRGGLLAEHIEKYRLPLSVEGHGYQWEALTDAQAREIISEATAGFIDDQLISAVKVRERGITKRFRERFAAVFLNSV